MTSTLSSALEVRGIPTGSGQLTTEVEADFGEAERDMTVLTQLSHLGRPKRVLSAVRLNYQLTVPKGKRETAEEALKTHDRICSVKLTLKRGVYISWTWKIQEKGS